MLSIHKVFKYLAQTPERVYQCFQDALIIRKVVSWGPIPIPFLN